MSAAPSSTETAHVAAPTDASGVVISCLNLFDSFSAMAYLDGSCRAADIRLQKLYNFELPSFLSHPPLYPTIAELAPGSDDAAAALVQQSLPFVIRGGVRDWPACSKWTPAFFASKHAQHEVEVTHAGGAKRMWALGDYISSWSSEPSTPSTSLDGSVPSQPDHPYLRGWSFDRELPELVDDIRVPCWAYDFFDKLPAVSRPPFHWIFLGPASTHTPLHVDPLLTHAWLAQIHGRKSFTIFPPRDLPYLLDSKGFANFLSPDTSRFPSLSKATPLEVLLQPGDILFVPRFWPHSVRALDNSISVTYNFASSDVWPTVRNFFLGHKLGRARGADAAHSDTSPASRIAPSP